MLSDFIPVAVIYFLYVSVYSRTMWTQQFVYTVAHYVDLKGYMWSTIQTYVCSVDTVRSFFFRILLVSECCVIKLACTVADNSVSFLGHGWFIL